MIYLHKNFCVKVIIFMKKPTIFEIV